MPSQQVSTSTSGSFIASGASLELNAENDIHDPQRPIIVAIPAIKYPNKLIKAKFLPLVSMIGSSLSKVSILNFILFIVNYFDTVDIFSKV